MFRTRRHSYWLILVVVAALVAGACSSRGGNADSTTTTSGSSTTGGSDSSSPCGPGDAKGATAKGVTDDAISIATIADIKTEAVGNLFQGNLDATKAFVAYCNSLGGINGREVKLDFIDSKLFEYPTAMRQACDGNYLALVGSASALDGGDGPKIGVDCGLVDVPGFAADSTHRSAENMVTPIPNPEGSVQIGAQLLMKKKYPDSVKKAVYVYSNRAVTMNTGIQRSEAMKKNGWVFSAPYVTSDLPSVQDYQAIVSNMQSQGIEWVSFVGAPAAQANLRKAMDIAGFHPQVSDADASAYDPQIVAAAGAAANGLNFSSVLFPLSQASENPETKLYLDWLKKTNAVTADQPTALGAYSFSAGLLFASVVKELGDDVTREALLAGLKKVHSWTGEGLHAEQDPGANTSSECMAWMTIKDQDFVRVQPAPSAKDAYECSPDYVVKVTPPPAG